MRLLKILARLNPHISQDS